MPNIQPYLNDILAAVYGEEVRGSIHDAIEAINNNVDASDQAHLMNSIASTYDTLSTSTKYNVGDYVFRADGSGRLYMCQTPTTGGIDFVGANWKEISLASILSKYVEVNHFRYDSSGGATILRNKSCDDLDLPSVWYIGYLDSAPAVSDFPFNSAGWLRVTATNTNNSSNTGTGVHVMQEAYPSNPATYPYRLFRTKDGNRGWSDWWKIPFVASNTNFINEFESLRPSIAMTDDNVRSLTNLDQLRLKTEFTDGKMIDSSGNVTNNSHRMATVDLIDLDGVDNPSISVTSGYRAYVYYYREDGTPLSSAGWITSAQADLNVPLTARYLKFTVASTGDSTDVKKDTDADKVVIHYTYNLYNSVKEALSFKGTVSTSMYDSPYSDINQITEYGMFAVASNALNLPVDVAGTLLVMPIGITDFTSGLYHYRKQQIFIAGTSIDRNIYTRYMSNSTTWSPNWTAIIDTTLPSKFNDIYSKSLTPSGFTSSNFQSGGINSAGGNTTNDSRIRTQGYVSVIGYGSMHYSIASGYRLYAVFFSSNSASSNIAHSEWVTDYGTFIFPEGTRYVRFQLASLGDATALSVSDYTVATIQWGSRLVDTANPIVKRTKWLAIGDSITFGVYSKDGEEVTCEYGWVHRLAESLDYDLTVMASRGMGYMERGDDPTNPDPQAPRWPLATLIERAIALDGDFNLITIALGINDYNAGGKTLDGIEASLRDTINTIVNRFPNSRLVVITPFNCTREGNLSTKYAYGAVHSPNDFTLQELSERIINVCNSLSVETIYATDCFVFNMVNITDLIPDGVHPSYEAHTLIAKNMAHYLLN